MSLEVLKMVAAAGPAGCYITAQQGGDLASKGFIIVNGNDRDPMNPNAFRSVLTTAGQQALGASVQAKPTFDLDSGIEIPTVKRGNPNIGNYAKRESMYPFDKMEVGQSFHVPCCQEDAEPWKKMASSVSAANKRFETAVIGPDGNPVMVQKARKVVVKDQFGPDGKPLKVEELVTVPQTVPGKRFKACQVSTNDPKGAGCRVFRVA